MTRDRRYDGNYRRRSPSTRWRRLSPPPVRSRDQGYSMPRRGDSMETKEDRRGGSYSRRDYDRRYERGDRDYEMNYDGRDRAYERNYERGSEDHGGNSDRGDKRYDRCFDNGGVRISDFDGGDRDRYREGDADATRSSIYKSNRDAGYSGRVFKHGGGLLQEDSTSAKFQWDHLLYETKNSEGFKGSIHHGTRGGGVKTELDYGYQRGMCFDEGRAGLDSKIAPVEAERGRDYSSSSYQLDVGVLRKSSNRVDALGGFISAPSNFSNSSLKDEDFQFRDKPHLGDGLLAEGAVLIREANPVQYSRADTHFMASSPWSKAFDAVSRGNFKKDVPGSFIPSNDVKLSSGVSSNYFGCDDYGAKSRTRSPVDCQGRLDDFKSYSRSYVDAAEERSNNFAYHEVGQNERSAMVTSSIEFYGNMEGVGDQYGHQDVSRVGVLDSNHDKVDGSSPRGYLRGNRLWDPAPSLKQSTSSYYDPHELSYANRQNPQDQDFRSSRPLHESDFYDGHHRSSILGGLHNDYSAAGSSWSPKKGADMLSPREYDPSLGNIDGRPQQELLLDDIIFPRPSKMHERYDTGKQASKHGSMVYDTGDAGESWRDNMDSNTLSKKLDLTNSKNGETRKISSLMFHQQPSRSSPVTLRRYSGKPHRFGTRDIKKRLGPSPQKAHVSERLTKFKPSLKGRLGHGPQKSRFTLPPWVKKLRAPKLPSCEDASDGGHLHQGEETQEHAVTLAKPEPPENSEEFRQLVSSIFFKFVKQLNETPSKRKKYKGQGEAGSLKCIVCGSSSEEFENTESLATHAFQSQKDGLRSQHLGFHKALCALMGWSAEAVNSVWIRETSSCTENSCIKKDLILWPPVVIVHNSTINQSPDQRVIITLEKLQARLRAMGFGDKMKVLRGKPANQSVMVVQFGGTLSGLLEAERLHRMYSKIKRGRAEFQQCVQSCNNGSYTEETKEKFINNLEHILYGYLGTAEDLDKLDFDMKKRCVVKSKKDIQNIAEAPL